MCIQFFKCTKCSKVNAFCFVGDVPFVAGLPQKKGPRPIVNTINFVECASCVNQSFCVQPVTNVHTAALICM